MQAQHHRFAIWNAVQHPYKHSLSEFSYTNPALPGVVNVQQALNYMLAVLYPQTQAAVATVAALNALVGNTINDFRVVTDDGDGKAAAYRWEQREGDASAKWYKIYDMDWGADSILEQFLTRTQSLYAFKGGTDDLDYLGAALAGTYAGQRIYGGKSASTNLTLSANSGDGVGANTGYVQTTDNMRPTADNTLDLGTSSLQFKRLYAGTSVIVAADLTVASGSITSASGAISFNDENLTTTGYLKAATIKDAAGTTILNVATGDIYNSSGSIVFGTNSRALYNGGTYVAQFSGGYFQADRGFRISSPDQGTNLDILKANGGASYSLSFPVSQGSAGNTIINDGSGNLSWTSPITTLAVIGASANANGMTLSTNTLNLEPASASFGGVVTTGTQTMAGAKTFSTSVAGGNLQLAGNILSSTNANGDMTFTPNGTGTVITSAILKPGTDNTVTLGTTSARWSTLYVGTSIGDGTNAILASELLALRNIKFRDAARTQAVTAGDTLFWDAVSGTWLASVPDTEITHSAISGLTTSDAGHTQFAMLAGRSGGQTLQGGTAGGEHLILESTANASKGLLKAKNSFVPFTTAAYSAGWTGTDLGSSSLKWNDIYMSGEAKGLRAENFTTAGLPGFSGQNPGRLMFDTTTLTLKLDTGASIVAVGSALVTVTSVSADTTITTAHQYVLVDDSGATKTMTLPAASTANIGIVYTFKKQSASNTTVIARAGSDTIDGGTSYTLTTQYQAVTIVCLTATTWGAY